MRERCFLFLFFCRFAWLLCKTIGWYGATQTGNVTSRSTRSASLICCLHPTHPHSSEDVLRENEKGIPPRRHAFEALASLFSLCLSLSLSPLSIVGRKERRGKRGELSPQPPPDRKECLVNSNWPPPPPPLHPDGPPLKEGGGGGARACRHQFPAVSHAKHDMRPGLIERTDFIPRRTDRSGQLHASFSSTQSPGRLFQYKGRLNGNLPCGHRFKICF